MRSNTERKQRNDQYNPLVISGFHRALLHSISFISRLNALDYTRVVPKVMSTNFFLANWEQQTKESKVVDETSCCVILECLVTSIACIT